MKEVKLLCTDRFLNTGTVIEGFSGHHYVKSAKKLANANTIVNCELTTIVLSKNRLKRWFQIKYLNRKYK